MYLSSITPDHSLPNEPVTPVRNPAMIDRRGLVGVGELTTPRWARTEADKEPDLPTQEGELDGYDVIVSDDVEEDQPDSPWTIEAVDGESSEKEEVILFNFRLDRHLFSYKGFKHRPSTSKTSHTALYCGRERGRGDTIST
jgi:hypothetical protein